MHKQNHHASGPEMQDKDRINDVLAMQKYLSTGYNTAVSEAGCDQLYRIELGMLDEIHARQRELFKFMNEKGWYPLENEDAIKIKQKAEHFASNRSQFPYS